MSILIVLFLLCAVLLNFSSLASWYRLAISGTYQHPPRRSLVSESDHAKAEKWFEGTLTCIDKLVFLLIPSHQFVLSEFDDVEQSFELMNKQYNMALAEAKEKEAKEAKKAAPASPGRPTSPTPASPSKPLPAAPGRAVAVTSSSPSSSPGKTAASARPKSWAPSLLGEEDDASTTGSRSSYHPSSGKAKPSGYGNNYHAGHRPEASR